MNQIYRYTRQKAVFSILIPAIMAALVFAVMILQWTLGQSTVMTMPLAVLSGIIVLDHTLALSHPQQITLGDGWIEFSGFGHAHHYALSEIQRINLRQNAFSKSVYVRINEAGLLKGRYWIQFDQLPDGSALRAYLEALVEQKHPKMKHFDRHSFSKTK